GLLAAGLLDYLGHQSTGNSGVARRLASTSTQPPARCCGQRREHERRRNILRGHPDATQVVGRTRGRIGNAAPPKLHHIQSKVDGREHENRRHHRFDDDENPQDTELASCDSHGDRKSTRLNSSHEWISYAVFCLKKKETTPQGTVSEQRGRAEAILASKD